MATIHPITARFLTASAHRITEAHRGGNPEAVQAAIRSFQELCGFYPPKAVSIRCTRLGCGHEVKAPTEQWAKAKLQAHLIGKHGGSVTEGSAA
jgi:hypothetical protein